jgi:predicted nucleic-acid-binding Zn-ribbon protein
MTCPKCGSENINVQMVSEVKAKKSGLIYWLCCLWVVDLLLWAFLTLPRLIVQIFKPKKYKSKTYSEAVCQNCGHHWKAK